MTHEEIKKLEENTEKYKKALTLVYADGDVTNVERNRLISLKNELGLSDSLCMAMEAHFHETADLDEIKVDEIKKIHHCFRRGLNSRPSDYETNALPTAPRKQVTILTYL